MSTGYKIKQTGGDAIWVSQNGLLDQYPGQLRTAVYANGKHTLGGIEGRIVDSTDGINWVIRDQLRKSTNWGSGTINIIINNGSLYLAGGGGARIATSTDGVTWTYQAGLISTGFGANEVVDACWNSTAGLFVVISSTGLFATSTNGVTWTYYTTLNTFLSSEITAGRLISTSTTKINWNGTRYTVVGGQGLVMTSTDLTTWTNQLGLSKITDNNWGITTQINQVILANSLYVSIGDSGRLATSTDGTTWTRRTLSTGTTYSLYSIAYGNSTYVAVGQSGRVWTSTDGTTWTTQTSLYGTTFGATNAFKIIFNGTIFVTASETGGVATSTDGVTWAYQGGLKSTTFGFNAVYDINWNGTQFLVAGYLGNVATSADGVTWTYQGGLKSTTYSTNTVYAIAWNGSKYCVGGSAGKVATSPDGVTWTYQAGLSTSGWGSTVSYPVYSLIWDSTNLLFVACGGDPTNLIASSLDGITWTNLGGTFTGAGSDAGVPRTSNRFKHIVWIGTQYFLSGSSGKLYTSTNLTTWSFVNDLSKWQTVWGYESNITSINWNGTQYLAVGQSGKCATSTDGATWTYKNSLLIGIGINSSPVNIIWDSTNSRYVVAGGTGVCGAGNSDASIWTAGNVGSTNFGGSGSYPLHYVFSGVSGSYFIVGDSRLATSSDGVNWTYSYGLYNASWNRMVSGGIPPGGDITITESCWNGSQYLIVGGNGRVATSPDAITWTYQPGLRNTAWSGLDNANAVVWNGLKYVVVGSNAKIATSPDGVTWTYQGGLASTSWGTTDPVNDIVWDGSKFVAVGGSGSTGKSATSTDGVTWTYGTPVSGNYFLNSLCWNGNKFVGGMNLGKVAISTNGLTWTAPIQVNNSWSTSISALIWFKDKFVLGKDSSGRGAYSYDGITWISHTTLPTTATYDMYDGGNRIVAVGSSAIAGVSYDGITWASLGSTGVNQYAITGKDDYYLTGGINGTTSLGRDNYTIDVDDVLVRREYFSDGNLFAWGQNSEGQIGDGTILNVSIPITITGNNWKQVAGGGYASAAIKTDGTLWSWGRYPGDNTKSNRSSPVTTAGGGTNWKQVSCKGNWVKSAIKTDGTLWTWGENGYGEVGDGTITTRNSPVTTAGGGSNWAQVSTANRAVFAIKTDGTLWTWGHNPNGQLGDGTTSSRLSPITTAGGGTNWKFVAGGLGRGSAIKTDGTLWSWGTNTGDGTSISKLSPVTTAGGGTNWKQVACGYHTLAIKTDGTLWGWGPYTNGLIGDGTTSDRSSPVSIAGGGTNWKQVDCGEDTSTAIKTDGTIWAWGRGTPFPKGDGTSSAYSSPVQVSLSGTNWKSIASGQNHRFAIQDLSL